MSYVLVVETEPSIRKFVTLVLERKGFQVAEAITPEQVLARMRANLPLVVVMDSRLMGATGWELLRILIDDPVLSSVPVVLLTATPSQNGDAKSKYVNVATQLTKPVSGNALVAAIRRAIDNREIPSSSSSGD